MPVEIPTTSEFRDGIEYGRAEERARVVKYLRASAEAEADYEVLLAASGQAVTLDNIRFMKGSHAAMQTGALVAAKAIEDGEHVR